MRLWPEIDEATHRQLGVALMSRRWAVATPAGPWSRRVGLVEAALADRFRCKHGVAVSNGSAALLTALQALGVGPGSRVLLPALTWVGCLTAVLRLGARPVLCDSAVDRLTADMLNLRHENVDAIIAIPLYAQLIDVAALRTAYPGTPVVLDMSHVSCTPSMESALREADIVVSSLQASKVLTCGEGGFAGTDNPVLAKRMQALRTDGRVFLGDAAHGDQVLSPHGGLHGANHAMSEIAAGLLLDQLRRLDKQCKRRAHGGQLLLDWFDRLGVRHYADIDCVVHGLHYGIPVFVHDDPDEVVADVAAHFGLRLDRCYPPLCDGPLCDPNSEPRYRHIGVESPDTPNARRWHKHIVVVPHEILLAPHDALASVAQRFAGKSALRVIKTASLPDVTVIVLTNGKRCTLGRALRSVEAQKYLGRIEVLLVLDSCDTRDLDIVPIRWPLRTLRIDLGYGLTTMERVAALRDMALRQCGSDLVCFLDDDNQWADDHIEILQSTMARAGTPTAHSWRRITDPVGIDWSGDTFPWLDEGSERERKQFEACRSLGIIESGSNIVRDNAFAETDGINASMVDLGAWLFRTDLLKLFGLKAKPPGCAAPVDGVGEDDILLEELKAAAVPIACSKKATLEYSLGGFSNVGRRRSLQAGRT